MNQLRHLKQYQSSAEDGHSRGPADASDGKDPEQTVKSQERYQNKDDGGEGLGFIDLSNIQNISDLNHLAEMHNADRDQAKEELQSPLDVENIAVDLDEDELEQMQRIIGRNVVYDKDRPPAISPQDQSLEKLQDYMMNTPPSDFSESEHKSKQILHQHQDQIQQELRQLLAQSPSAQILMMNDETHNNQHTSSEERELRKKWLHDNGLFSQEPSQHASPEDKDLEENEVNEQQFFAKTDEKSIELGEQPLDVSNKDLLNEDFALDSHQPVERTHSSSPPRVTPKGRAHAAQKPPQIPKQQNYMGSPKNFGQNQDLTLMGHTDAKPQFPRAQDAQALTSPKEVPHSQTKAKDVEKAIDQSNGEGDENDSFHRLYNKEIKVNQDEIPLLLLELTDIAYKFIKKDQFEKAYVLLQKTESVLEVVNLDHSKRDRYFAYITYLNMAMCFQKLGMLEECIIYLKETIQVIEKPNFFKDVSISQRMKQMHMQCQLKLQLCAILSQTQKHTEAMDHAKASVRLAHQILRDMYDLCVFYSNKIKFKDDFASLSLLVMEDAEDGSAEQSKAQNASKCYQEFFQNSNRGSKPPKHSKSEINERVFQKQFIRENSPVRDIPFNILEESISMIERTALKMLPIMKELGNRLAGTTGKKGLQAFHTLTGVDSVDTKNLSEQKQAVHDNLKSKQQANDKGLLVDESEERDIKDVEVEIKEAEKKAEPSQKAEDQVDMRTVLGFLNQNEWILNLNIGNIMQIQPIRMRDFLTFNRNEHQLSRESFLEKLQLLVVSYFCVSTELRFIIQSRSGFMKPETKKEKELEQEYWHVKALDIACAFLPSECPLFNHILLSYQKHHDPTMQPIEEDKEQEDTLTVLRPLKGIENSKYQPIVREVENVYVDIPEIPLSPLSKCFDQRLMPRKVKTTSVDVQTEAIEQPKPPLMKSQSISIQSDLRIPEIEKSPQQRQVDKKNSQTISDVFDVNNAYMDLSSSKYQESLISRIIEDPKIDKQNFLNKLITRVNSSDPEHFAKMSRFGTQNQGFGQGSSNFYQQTTHERTNMHTLSDHLPNSGIIDDAIYGSRHGYKQAKTGKSSLLVNKTKNTQSGQLSKKRTGQGLDELQHSFEHNSQHVKNHMRSLYRDHNNSQSDATAMGGNVKHHIASQSLAPSANVFTDQKLRPKNSGLKQSSHVVYHKKNQSISGANLAHESSSQTHEMFTKTNVKQSQKTTMELGSMQQKFNNSVNSNLSKGTKNTRKKATDSRIQEQRAHVQARQANSKERQFTKINLSNEKGKKGVNRYQGNIVCSKSKERQQSGSKSKAQHKKGGDYTKSQLHHPTSKTEHSISKVLGDVMSSSYSQSAKSGSSPMSGADPDLLQAQFPSQPEDSLSEMNKTNPTNKSLQSIILDQNQGEFKEHAMAKKERDRQRGKQLEQKAARDAQRNQEQPPQPMTQQDSMNIHAQPGKSRPSSAITNYTSGQSALRGKMNAKRLQQNSNQRLPGKQQRLQLSQNIVQSTKQAKQRHVENGVPLVPKKKSKVLSRKKYGSDQSSDSPPPHGAIQNQHGYSIAPGPFSIFDSGNSHTQSKVSNLQQSKTQIPQPEHLAYYNEAQASGVMTQHLPSSKKVAQASKTHVNSQTIQVQHKEEKQKQSKHQKATIVQNQSEHILGKLQNLLVSKRPETKVQTVSSSQLHMKHQQRSGSQYNGQYLSSSNPRKQAQSIGSLGYSQTRQSRFSQNSKKSNSKKSRYSRSKSSGKSASKSAKGQRSQSNERSQPHFVNNSHKDISPQINQSQIVMSNNFLDADIDPRNHASFELKQLLNELQNNKSQQQPETGQPKRKNSKVISRGQRPKSSLLFDLHRESLQNSKKGRQSANSKSRMGQKANPNHSIENLQRQVLENQKILLSNLATHQKVSQKQSKRGASKGHNHNNSISHLMPGTGSSHNCKNLLLTDETKFFSNKSGQSSQLMNKLMHHKTVAPLSSTSMGKKKSSSKAKRERHAKQQQQNTSSMIANMNTQRIGGLLTQGGRASALGGGNKANMMNLKMTQQHLSVGLKQLASIMEAGRGGISTTASTTAVNNQNALQSGKSMKPRKQIGNQHKRKQSSGQQYETMMHQAKNMQFVNFEQMQQQLKSDMQLGGVDLQQNDRYNNSVSGHKLLLDGQMQNMNQLMHLNKEQMHINQFTEQQHGFVPLKNMMPKTTGSQAHLLNIQQQTQHEAASAVAAGLSGCVSGANLKSYNSLNQTGRASNFNRNIGVMDSSKHIMINQNQQFLQ